MSEPFLHIDNDVVIRSPLPEGLLRKELIAQSIYPINLIRQIKSLKNDRGLISYIDKLNNTAFNAGVCGGNNYQFFKELFDLAKDIMEHNETCYGSFNMFIEESLTSILAQSKGLEIATVFNGIPTEEQAVSMRYTHLAGGMKFDENYITRVKLRIESEFPDYYNLINNVCNVMRLT